MLDLCAGGAGRFPCRWPAYALHHSEQHDSPGGLKAKLPQQPSVAEWASQGSLHSQEKARPAILCVSTWELLTHR